MLTYSVFCISRGIGAGIALELAQKGANVVVNYLSDRSREAAVNVVARIEEYGSKALLCASMSVLDDLPKLVEAAVEFSATGKIDILVHKLVLRCCLYYPH